MSSYYKLCKYGCNTKIRWDTNLAKFVEEDGAVHDRGRCEGLRPGVAAAPKEQQVQVRIPSMIANNPIVTSNTVQISEADWHDFMTKFDKLVDLVIKMGANNATMLDYYDGLVEQQRQLTRLLTKPLDEKAAEQEARYDRDKEDGTPWQ